MNALHRIARLSPATAILAASLALGGCDQRSTDPAPPAAVERLVDVGGYRLQVREQAGEGPTVVLMSGLGEPLETWRSVPEAIADFAAVVSYDRAGIGRSDAVAGTRTATDVAQELHALLAAAGVPAPYVLVAHSIAGLHMQRFAQLHPTEVAGLVFVDATPEAQLLQLASALPPELPVAQFLAQVADEQGLTDGARAEFLASVTSAEQVRDGGPLPDVPTYVLTSMRVENGGSVEERQAWFAMHAAWASRMSDATHLGVADAGHHIHWDRPSLVIEAAHRLVLKCR